MERNIYGTRNIKYNIRCSKHPINTDSDNLGIVYTESGFATPFINIGPTQLTQSDTIYICTYGTTSQNCDISASLSFNVNM